MRYRGFKWISFATMTILIVGLGIAIRPMFHPGKHHRKGPWCTSNIRQVAIALQAYLASTGSFPPAYTVDENGKPLHSWRTLILPLFDELMLLKQIDLTKPWDDPVNQPFHNVAIPAYRCPDTDLKKGFTTYHILVGPDACLLATEPRNEDDIKANWDQTLMLVEVSSDKAVHWMDPTDNAMEYLLTEGHLKNPAHGDCTCVVYLDGRGSVIRVDTPLEVRRALISITNQQKPDPDRD